MNDFDFNLSGVTPESVRHHVENHAEGVKLDTDRLNQAVSDIASVCRYYNVESSRGR